MASESINFSEELIPEVVEIVRMGIVRSMKRADARGDRKRRDKTKRASLALEEQCVELMEYWDRLQGEG